MSSEDNLKWLIGTGTLQELIELAVDRVVENLSKYELVTESAFGKHVTYLRKRQNHDS